MGFPAQVRPEDTNPNELVRLLSGTHRWQSPWMVGALAIPEIREVASIGRCEFLATHDQMKSPATWADELVTEPVSAQALELATDDETMASDAIKRVTSDDLQDLLRRTQGLEAENQELKQDRTRLMSTLATLSKRIEKLEEKSSVTE